MRSRQTPNRALESPACARDRLRGRLLAAGGRQSVNGIVHFRPVHLRTEVMFGVVSVIEKEPVVELAVAAMPLAIGLLGFAS